MWSTINSLRCHPLVCHACGIYVLHQLHRTHPLHLTRSRAEDGEDVRFFGVLRTEDMVETLSTGTIGMVLEGEVAFLQSVL